jgi:very-short-patch-repair endonuclease
MSERRPKTIEPRVWALRDRDIHSLKIAIEIDGGQHAVQSKQDAMRTKFLESEGLSRPAFLEQ